MLACAGLFSSCEREVETYYQYSVSDISMTGDPRATTVTTLYLDVLGWNGAEYIDNDAATEKKAREQNDREAIQEFNEKVAKYNEYTLYARYAQEGISSAQGSFTYQVIRVEDAVVLQSKTFTVNYVAQ